MACFVAAPLSGQVGLHVSAGARYSATLVHDSIVSGFDVRPGIAPVLAVSAVLPGHRGWSGEATLDVSWSTLSRHENGTTTSLGGLGAVSFAVGLRRQIIAALGARVTAGGLKYLPANESGVFRGGAGEVYPVLGVAVDYRLPFGPGLTLDARADAHQFSTRALRDAGFVERRMVPRVTLAVRADLGRLW